MGLSRDQEKAMFAGSGKTGKGIRKKQITNPKLQTVKGTRFKKQQTHQPVLPNVYLNGENFSFETENGKIKSLSLGNFTDSGWYWNGDESDLNTFLVRLASSKIGDEVGNDLEKNGITIEMLKPQMLHLLKGDLDNDGNGLYPFTGDNKRWKFGDEFDEGPMADELLDGLVEREKINEEQKQKLSDGLWIHYTGVSYGDYLKKHGKEVKENLEKIINKSTDFNDFNNRIVEEKRDQAYLEEYWQMINDSIYEAIKKAAEKEKIKF